MNICKNASVGERNGSCDESKSYRHRRLIACEIAATESVVYIFRDKSDTADTTIRLRGLDPNARYRLTSLNDRPGREKVIAAEALTNGIFVHLPNEWLANGDGPFSTEFTDQQRYGSDIWLLQRMP